MAAHENLHPDQFPSVMSPAAIKAMVTVNEHELDVHEGDVDALWAAKSARAERTGLTASVKKHGVREPVQVWHNTGYPPTLVEGYGRVQAAEDVGAEGVPVRHERIM